MEEGDGADLGGEICKTCREGIEERYGEGIEDDHDERIHEQDGERVEDYNGEWIADEKSIGIEEGGRETREKEAGRDEGTRWRSRVKV